MSKFWGLTISVGKKFKQQVEEAFCLSGAALEPSQNQNLDVGGIVQLYLQKDQNDVLICSLVPKQGIFQVPLNVRVGKGETVGFHLKGGSLGKTKVHLSGFTLPYDVDSAITGVPFQGQSQSILVTEAKSEDKLKKRVSIQDEPYGEMETESSDDDDDDIEDDEINSMRKKIFNGGEGQVQEDSSDDDDDDDDDIELDDDEDEDEESGDGDDLAELELQELQQLKSSGKYSPKSGSKIKQDSEDDSVELDDEEDEDETPKKVALQNSKNKQESPSSKQKNKLNTPTNVITKTPENKNIKLKTPSSAGHTPMKTFTKGGVLVNDIKVGNGQVAKPGKMVAVNYVGRLKQNNKQFDANSSAKGFSFRLGKGEVIKGWDLGVDGMKIGGKRRLIIPAQLAYGKRGAPPDIPPNSTLVFEVDLKNVS